MAKTIVGKTSKTRRGQSIFRRVLAIFFVILAFGYQLHVGWFYLGGKNGFGDLGYVLERIPCISNDWASLYGPRTDEACSGYIYGSSLLILLDMLGLSLTNLVPISYGLATSLILVYMWTFLKQNFNLAQHGLAIALLFSPPIILLIERMNVDVIVFLCVYLAIFLPRKISKWASLLLVALSALFKFYTFPLLVIMLRKVQGKLRIYLLPVVISTLVIILIDLGRINGLPWDARNMFGNAIWGEYLLYVLKGPQTHANFALSSLLGIAILLFVNTILRQIHIDIQLKSAASDRDQKLFVYCLILYLTCYFSGLSVDYRLVFLLFAYLIFENMFSLNVIGLAIVRVGVLLIFYLSYNTEKLQPLGDIAQVVVLIILVRGLSLLLGVTARDIFDKSFVVARVIFARITRNRKEHYQSS